MIYFFPRYNNLGASSRLRIIQFYKILLDQNIKFESNSLIDNKMLSDLYKNKRYNKFQLFRTYFKRLFFLIQIPSKSTIFIEKELFPFAPFWIEKLLISNHKVIIDYDDAIFTFYEEHNLSIVKKVLGKKIDRLMLVSNTVICGSHFILNRAKSAGALNLELIPTVVDISRYKIQLKKSLDIPVIVWIGTPSTIHFIEIIKPVLIELSHKYSFIFRVIGFLNLEIPNVTVECFPWSLENEINLLADSDIGIMPLYDTNWEKGKCGYKLIQYMASGLPVVGSAVGENNFIINDSCGYTAKNHYEWFKYLEVLIQNKTLRKFLGMNGRKRVEMKYSLNAISNTWLSCIKN